MNIRPVKFDDYIGQEKIKKNLKIYIQAAKQRKESLDHILFFGPPGLGKTTLARIIANEMGCDIKTVNGANIEKQGDLASLLVSIKPGEILFIDEIHRLSKSIEEILYHALEDFKLIAVSRENNEIAPISIQLPPFTLIGATTSISSISLPLKSRFPIIEKINFYEINELKTIILKISHHLNTKIDEKTAELIASRSRGTPRTAINLFKRIRDFANINNSQTITKKIALTAFKNIKLNEFGLYDTDIEYLRIIAYRFNNGPVGIKTIACSIGEYSKNIEETYEPYLIRLGFINKTSNGRIITKNGINFLKKIKINQ